MASTSSSGFPSVPHDEPQSLSPTAYTVGWLSALLTEFKAAQAMLDKRHNPLETVSNKNDKNDYVLGSIGKHNVVMVCLAEYGVVRAAATVSTLLSSFVNIRLGVMVGIGGGIPSEDHDIRLGDIVVSMPTGEHGGVIQYDIGKIEKDGFYRVHSLNKPDMQLRNVVNTLKTKHDLEQQISNLKTEAFKPFPRWEKEFKQPGTSDRLFNAQYQHVGNNRTCDGCDEANLEVREDRADSTIPEIHYGNIASGNSVIKNAEDRDRLAKRDNVICFDMEAAGLMDDLPCLVIRGICDYADSHKNKQWQPYAAAAAAAYAKVLLLHIRPQAVEELRPIRNSHWIVSKSVNSFFTGRQRILQTLQERLCQDDDKQNIEQKRFVIHGIGGSGKSEHNLLINRSRFWGVFWVDATTEESMRRGIIGAAQRVSNASGMTFEDAKIELANFQHTWLLILDNADDPEINYEDYFPTGNTGNILTTTRNHDCIKYGSAGHETFEKLDLEDAVTLLLKSSKIAEERWNANKADACTVGICKLQNYQILFEHQRKELLEDHFAQGKSTYGSVYAAFDVSARAMEKSSRRDWRDALALLKILGYFYRDNIPEETFTRAWSYSHEVSDWGPHGSVKTLSPWHVHHIRKVLRPQTSSQALDLFALGKARQVLRSFSLITLEPETGAISMHPLAHAWTRDRLQSDEQIDAWAATSSILALSMKGYNSYDDYIINIRLQSHFKFCFQLRPSKTLNICPGLEICRTLYAFWWMFYRLENAQPAHEIATLLMSWGNLAKAYLTNGEARKAAMLLRYVHFMQEKTLGSTHDWNLITQHALAVAYLRLNQTEKGLLFLEKVVRIWQENQQDPTHPYLLVARKDLAIAYMDVGQPHKALYHFQERARIYAETLRPDDPKRSDLEEWLSSCEAAIMQQYDDARMENSSSTKNAGVYEFKIREAFPNSSVEFDLDDLSEVETPSISDESSLEISDTSDGSASGADSGPRDEQDGFGERRAGPEEAIAALKIENLNQEVEA
ncbi:hypothetical protein G7Y89_g4154 [Cudoniella acicularis]|uniref:Nucleoside phosphorylase domain-containing protein n=1 Tax=Cudoniella acicularis TaxID=354080 RepID=A0A8H4W598_9HELO|nr:hypothetical protein G7Y89_g4154 [Cudoniella acicularis]